MERKRNLMTIINGIRLLFWSFLSLSVACSGSPQPPTPPSAPIAGVLCLVDSVTFAGENISIFAISDQHTFTDSLHLIWSDAYGDIPYIEETRRGDTVYFAIAEQTFQRSGTVILSLCQKGQILDQKSLKILPLSPIGIIETYAGEKTMFVKSDQTAMVVAIPKDTFGNPSMAGTQVQYALRYPGAPVSILNDVINKIVSAQFIGTGPQTGKILIGVSSGEANSIEETIGLTPTWPSKFNIQAEAWFPFADSRQNIIVRTDFIRDGWGNVVTDGTLIHFVVEEDGIQVAKYRGYSSSGAAQIQIENPDHAADWKIYALSEGGIRSNTINLHFDVYIQDLPFYYDSKQKGIVVGPVSGTLGQMVTDDLEVQVILEHSDNEYRFFGLTENGFCTVLLPDTFPPGRYQCQVLAGGQNDIREISIE